MVQRATDYSFWRLAFIVSLTASLYYSPALAQTVCKDKEFRCRNDNCISREWVCDHDNDCFDGSDETNCTYEKCQEHYFRCDGFRCLPATWICDGTRDCKDGTDEDNCRYISRTGCKMDEWQCKGGECIAMSKICDGRPDCRDFSDEDPSCGINECDTGDHDCQDVCVDLAIGYRCDCNPGFRPAGNGSRNCTDINECAESPYPCSQKCQNTNGSFSCSCDELYYLLGGDNATCVRQTGPEPWILYGDRNSIFRLDLNASHKHLLTVPFGYGAIAYHFKENKLYYTARTRRLKYRAVFSTDLNPQTIVQKNPPVGEDSPILRKRVASIDAIAIDWVTSKFYYNSRSEKTIAVCEVNGTHCKTLLRDQNIWTRDMALYPAKGYLFFTVWSLAPFIGRLGMDGVGFRRLAVSNTWSPRSITVDEFSEKIFWCDSRGTRIWYMDLDGSNRRSQVLQPGGRYSSIAVFDNMAYIVDQQSKGIYSATKFSGTSTNTIKDHVNDIEFIQIVHPLLQVTEEAGLCQVDNGGCSHLCLIANGGNGSTCACPDSFVLKDNGTDCLPNCYSSDFVCPPPDEKCIPHAWVCDGVNDCDNSEDEVNCDTAGSTTPLFDVARDDPGCPAHDKFQTYCSLLRTAVAGDFCRFAGFSKICAKSCCHRRRR